MSGSGWIPEHPRHTRSGDAAAVRPGVEVVLSRLHVLFASATARTVRCDAVVVDAFRWGGCQVSAGLPVTLSVGCANLDATRSVLEVAERWADAQAVVELCARSAEYGRTVMRLCDGDTVLVLDPSLG